MRWRVIKQHSYNDVPQEEFEITCDATDLARKIAEEICGYDDARDFSEALRVPFEPDFIDDKYDDLYRALESPIDSIAVVPIKDDFEDVTEDVKESIISILNEFKIKRDKAEEKRERALYAQLKKKYG